MTAEGSMPPMPQGRVYEVDEVDDTALRKSFEEAHTKFYALLGYCVTRWAFFDRELLEIFRLSADLPTGTAAVIFYRSPHISDHLSLAARLLELKIKSNKTLLSKWTKLKTRIDDGLQVRNYVAHQPVAGRAQKVFYPPANARKGTKIKIEEAVLFIYNEALKPRKGKWDYIGPDELRDFVKDADELYNELIAFTAELRSLVAPHE